MIELIPFYMNLTAGVHREERDNEDRDQNRRYSVSLLNSLLPVIADYSIEHYRGCTVIVTPSPKESNVIASYLIKQINERDLGPRFLNLVRLCDLKSFRVVDEAGIHIMCIPNAEKYLVSCDKLINYYPLDIPRLNNLYRRSRNLVMFDPVNNGAGIYKTYIRLVTNTKTGVRR